MATMPVPKVFYATSHFGPRKLAKTVTQPKPLNRGFFHARKEGAYGNYASA